MSFWKKAGELALKTGSYALKEVKAANERSAQYNEEMPGKNDDELIRIIKKKKAAHRLRHRQPIRSLKTEVTTQKT